MAQDLVTVLTVTRRPWLVSRLVQSVSAQDFHGPLRHIVLVDDDERVCRALDAEQPRHPVEVILVPRAPSDADGPARLAVLRNMAVELAGPQFIAFHDDDNTWEPHHLSSLWRTRSDESADIVHSERKLFESDGEPYLRPEFPWGRHAATRRAIYAYCVEAEIMERGSNVMRDRFEMRFTWIDLGEWLFPPGFLAAYPFETSYSSWDWYNISVEDQDLPRVVYESGLRVASTRAATLNYYLGGYTNLYEGEGLVWERPDSADACV